MRSPITKNTKRNDFIARAGHTFLRSSAGTDRCRKCVTHFAECYFIITFCDMHNNCQQLDGTLPAHLLLLLLLLELPSLIFAFRQLLARMKLLILSDTWSRLPPPTWMCLSICLYVFEYTVIGMSCRMALAKSKPAWVSVLAEKCSALLPVKSMSVSRDSLRCAGPISLLRLRAANVLRNCHNTRNTRTTAIPWLKSKTEAQSSRMPRSERRRT